MKTKQENAAAAIEIATEQAGRTAEIIDMPRPLPDVIQLTRHELIEAENLNLKMRLLDAEFANARRQLLDADKAWTAGVASRLGVEIGRYKIDFASGTGRLVEEQ